MVYATTVWQDGSALDNLNYGSNKGAWSADIQARRSGQLIFRHGGGLRMVQQDGAVPKL